MLLSIHDRLMVLNLLPKQGDITMLRVIDETLKTVGFSDEEVESLDFKHDEGGTKWNDTIGPKEIAIGSAAAGLLRHALKKKNDDKALSLDEIPFYERIMEDGDGKKDSEESDSEGD